MYIADFQRFTKKIARFLVYRIYLLLFFYLKFSLKIYIILYN
nr:MAG TPA: hypothetical protein [Caudoviricetes sp.]